MLKQLDDLQAQIATVDNSDRRAISALAVKIEKLKRG